MCTGDPPLEPETVSNTMLRSGAASSVRSPSLDHRLYDDIEGCLAPKLKTLASSSQHKRIGVRLSGAIVGHDCS